MAIFKYDVSSEGTVEKSKCKGPKIARCSDHSLGFCQILARLRSTYRSLSTLSVAFFFFFLFRHNLREAVAFSAALSPLFSHTVSQLVTGSLFFFFLLFSSFFFFFSRLFSPFSLSRCRGEAALASWNESAVARMGEFACTACRARPRFYATRGRKGARCWLVLGCLLRASVPARFACSGRNRVVPSGSMRETNKRVNVACLLAFRSVCVSRCTYESFFGGGSINSETFVSCSSQFSLDDESLASV